MKTVLSLLALALFCVCLFFQLNLHPLHRIGSWDWLWGEARVMGMLEALKLALHHGELPMMDFNHFLGWNLGGDIYSFWNPLNFLVAFFEPRVVFEIRNFSMVLAGCLGAFVFVRRICKDWVAAWIAGLFYCLQPQVFGLGFSYSYSYPFYMLPWLLLSIDLLLERRSTIAMLCFFLTSALSLAVSDFNGIPSLTPVVAVFSFFMAWKIYGQSALTSLFQGVGLTLVFLSAGAPYLVSFFQNMHVRSEELAVLREAGLTGISRPSGVHLAKFLKIWRESARPTFTLPQEGAGMTFFASPVFWITALAVIPFQIWMLLTRANSRNERRMLLIPLILLASCIIMVAEPIILHSRWFKTVFPFLGDNSKGTVRYQTNLIPFALILAGTVALAHARKACLWLGQRQRVLIALLVTAGITFVTARYALKFHHVAATRMDPETNLIALPRAIYWIFFTATPGILMLWLLLPLQWLRRPLVSILVLTPLAFMFGTSLNGIYLGHNKTFMVASPYRYENFKSRLACHFGEAPAHDIQTMRTLYTLGASEANRYNGLSWKTNIELEYNPGRTQGLGTLVSYRELSSPIQNAFLSSLRGGKLILANQRTFKNEDLANQADRLRLFGVGQIVALEDPLPGSPDWTQLSRCETPPAPPGVTLKDYQTEAGVSYSFRLKNSLGIAWVGSRYEIGTQKDNLLRTIRGTDAPHKVPWTRGIALLEKIPETISQPQKNSDDSPLKLSRELRDLQIGSQSITATVDAPDDRIVTFALGYHKNFKAWIGEKEAPILRSFGGLMSIAVPRGRSTLRLAYQPVDAWRGLGIMALGLFAALMILFFSFRNSSTSSR